MSDEKREFSPNVIAVIDEFVPIIKKWDVGKYAISIGGSQGKGMWDNHSDVDFRLFHEKYLPWVDVNPELWKECFEAINKWGKKGVIIDGVWARQISKIDAALDRWLSGDIKPEDCIWSIWGYHLLPDLYHQAVIEDPYNIIQHWKEKLRIYPPKLKKAILDKHLASMRYWRNDYHYQNKVKRGDMVFLAALSSRLVHDVMQVLFALNETYYVGDGQNLDFAKKFKWQPAELEDAVKSILYPSEGNDVFVAQRDAVFHLIDDVLRLADEVEKSSPPAN